VTSRVTNSAFDEIVDIAVVGSGAGGLTGTVAARNGLKPVVFEGVSLG
jgi:thioredoxin reductase